MTLIDKLRDAIRSWLEATPPKVTKEDGILPMASPPSLPIIVVFSNGDRVEVEAYGYWIRDDSILFYELRGVLGTAVEIARISRADIDYISIGDIIHECTTYPTAASETG
jgi:hypothetical protein